MLKRRIYVREIGLKVGHALWERDDLGSNPRSPIFCFYFLLLFFAFIFTSIPAFYGYNVQGGALEVGKAGTKAVVDSSIAILIANLILTQIML